MSKVQAASTITTRPVEWLWDGWLPSGAFSLLTGKQEVGKTALAAEVVARLTTGRAMPNDVERPAIAVGFLSTEESNSRVVSRLKAAGADLDRVFILGLVSEDVDGETIERPFQIPRDLGALASFIEEHSIGLLVLDGLPFLVGTTGEPSYSVISAALSGLSQEAERTGCPILGLAILSNSTAWTAMARTSWLVGRDIEREEGRTLAVGKTNRKKLTYSFEIADDAAGLGVGVVANLTPRGLLADSAREATDFLIGALSDGPRPVTELFQEAEAHGLSRASLTRAKRGINATSHKVSRGAGWQWAL